MPTIAERCKTLFPTAVVGSLPRPGYVREIVIDGRRDEGYERRLDAGVAYAVSVQEAAGIDVISDGEWRRASYIGIIAELADGFELSQTDDGRPWTVVTEKVAVRDQGVVAAEVKHMRALTDRLIKVALPSPALLAERMWDEERSSAAYETPRAFAEAVAPVLRREAELVVEAGADVVQVDDPHLCLLVDPEVRARYDDSDWGAEAEAEFSVDMDNEVLIGIAGEAVRAVHLCRRAGARVRGEAYHSGDYSQIAAALEHLDTDHLTLEFTSPGAGDVAVLEQLPDHLEIGLGCVSVHPGEVDDAVQIVERVEQAVEVIGAERIVLNPDCGFAPGSAARVDLDEVYAKLRNQVEAAQQLRDIYA
jgi:5-methyltetrahydropteroyltriglutamate--homocysteine methyltransferase